VTVKESDEYRKLWKGILDLISPLLHNTFTSNKGDGLYSDLKTIMKRGSIICQRCGRKRTSRVCEFCGYDACCIRIRVQGKDQRIYHDKNGKALSFPDAVNATININKEIEARTFDIKNWLKGSIEKRKFKIQWEIWIDQKQKEVKSSDLSPSTLRAYKSYYKNHFQSLKELDVRDIRLKHLKELKDDFPDHLSHKTIKNMMDCLRSFFRWLVRWGELDKEPIFPKNRVTRGDQQLAILYEEQMEAIASLPEEHRDIFYFMREQGLRVSEVCAIQCRDFDFRGQRILIQRTYSDTILVETTKGKHRDWMPLSELAYEIAMRNIKGKSATDFMFINPNTQRGYKAQYLRKVWRDYGIKDITLYEAMRHSTITDWAENGTTFEVQKAARHSDIRTTRVYVHTAQEGISRLINRRKVVEIKKTSRIN